MKIRILVPTVILGLALAGLVGCSKSDSSSNGTASGGATIDTAKVKSAFSTAAPADKGEVDKAITAIKAGDYTTAAAALKQAAASVNLTPEQKQAISDLIAQVQAKLSGSAAQAMDGAKAAADDATKKAGDAANKTAADLQKSLPK